MEAIALTFVLLPHTAIKLCVISRALGKKKEKKDWD